MMRIPGVSLCALACVLAASGSCVAQENPWNGSWKAVPSTYKYSGPTYSISTDETGYTVSRDGKAQPKVVCDGKPQKTAENEMTSCTKAGTGYVVTVDRDGKRVRKSEVTLSADGKTRTVRSAITMPDANYTVTSVAKRVSGGPGMSGEWKEVSNRSSDDGGLLSIAVKGDSVDFKETDNNKPVTCKLDGTPTKFAIGDMAVKLADPHTLKVTYSTDGKVRRENTFVLSADGKMITETDVTPDPSPSTMVVMFHKS
jgi:hypothetical protein